MTNGEARDTLEAAILVLVHALGSTRVTKTGHFISETGWRDLQASLRKLKKLREVIGASSGA